MLYDFHSLFDVNLDDTYVHICKYVWSNDVNEITQNDLKCNDFALTTKMSNNGREMTVQPQEQKVGPDLDYIYAALK